MRLFRRFFNFFFQLFLGLLNPKSFDITSVVLLLEKYLVTQTNTVVYLPTDLNWQELSEYRVVLSFLEVGIRLLPLLLLSEWWNTLLWSSEMKRNICSHSYFAQRDPLILRLFFIAVQGSFDGWELESAYYLHAI